MWRRTPRFDTRKASYILRVLVVYWLAVGGFVAAIYGLSRLFKNPATFGTVMIAALSTGLVGWSAAKQYKWNQKVEAERQRWRAEDEEREAQWRAKLEGRQ
jgi:hypothetical protein